MGKIAYTALGLLGDLLVTLGVIAGLFAAWQVFYTDWEVSSSQQEIVQEFYESTGSTGSTNPVGEKNETGIGIMRTDTPPVIEEPVKDETFGVLHVPAWGDDYKVPIMEGTSWHDVLNEGAAGHYETSNLPGEDGNMAMAGHRTSYGSIFKRVEDINKEDEIIVETADHYYVYKTYNTAVVNSNQGEVIAAVPNEPSAKPKEGEHYVTLTTCHPMYSTAERYIIWGEFEYWMDKADGAPVALVDQEG